MMKIFLVLCLVFSNFLLEGSVLEMQGMSKQEYIKKIENLSIGQVWDIYLTIQTDLYFPKEHQFLTTLNSWDSAESLLDLGCGNGHYLHRLAHDEPRKSFVGIDNNTEHISSAIDKYQSDQVSFYTGNAMELQSSLVDTFDIAIFRFVLQHLSDPQEALRCAHRYLKKGGYIVIMDSCDGIRESSSTIQCLSEAMKLHNKINQEKGMGNRNISLELLRAFENSQSMYEVSFSNIDREGKKVQDVVTFTSKKDRELTFHHTMLHLAILNKQWEIPVDFNQAYDEVYEKTQADDFWLIPGMHYMILHRP